MKYYARTALSAAAVALCLSSTPAMASSCWTQADVSAAKVRQMQTMLMVAALRCHAGGINILASYNHFVSAKRSELNAANARLHAHFHAERDYDRYTTALANRYGGARTNDGSCADAAAMAKAAIHGNLIAVADREIASPKLPSGRCSGREERLLIAAR